MMKFVALCLMIAVVNSAKIWNICSTHDCSIALNVTMADHMDFNTVTKHLYLNNSFVYNTNYNFISLASDTVNDVGTQITLTVKEIPETCDVNDCYIHVYFTTPYDFTYGDLQGYYDYDQHIIVIHVFFLFGYPAHNDDVDFSIFLDTCISTPPVTNYCLLSQKNDNSSFTLKLKK